MSCYRVTVTREHRSWLADVPALEGAHTWATNLVALDHAIREVIVLAADLPDDAVNSVRIEWHFHTGDNGLDVELEELRHRRTEVASAERDVADRTAETARRLVGGGYSVRDAARLLGISHQRVSQMTGRPQTAA